MAVGITEYRDYPAESASDAFCRIAYKIKNEGIEVVRLWNQSEEAVVPEEIDGYPVISIAPYAFSSHKEKEDEEVHIWQREDGKGIFVQEPVMRCGGNLREIHLPKTVRTIGNYAFYGCMNMKLFHATDRVVQMGSGVFTGCRLSGVRIDFYDGEKSCLKEILTDIRYEITAELIRHENRDGGSKAEEVRILFPEYYADAVENTPARIVETHYYGSGGDYRECFYRRELDYQKYDSMFALSAARDHGEVTARVALARLMYPRGLSQKARTGYETYLKEHMGELTEYCLEHLKKNENMSVGEPLEILEFCCRSGYYSGETLEEGINAASRERQMEVLSILMDERHRHFPKKKKSFEL